MAIALTSLSGADRGIALASQESPVRQSKVSAGRLRIKIKERFPRGLTMRGNMRRTVTVLLGICLAVLSFGPKASAQVVQVQVAPAVPVAAQGKSGNPGEPTEPVQAIQLPTNDKLKRSIEAVEDNIKVKNWEEASTYLQKLLDLPEDYFVEVKSVGPDGKEEKIWRNLRDEADRLVGSLPSEGLKFYRQVQSAKAREALNEAVTKNDPELLARVVQRYLHTDSGAEAVNLLGTYHLDRGHFNAAALCYSRLFRRDGIEGLSPLTLFKAMYAFQHTPSGDDKDNIIKSAKEIAWKQLQAKSPDGLHLSGRVLPFDEVQKLLDSNNDATVATLSDWPMYNSKPSRVAQAKGSPPFLRPAWPPRSNFYKGMFDNSNSDEAVKALLFKESDGVVRKLEEQGQPILPSLFPIAVTTHTKSGATVPTVIFRSYGGIHAYDIRDGKVQWQGDLNWTLQGMASHNLLESQIRPWVQQYYMLMGRGNLLVENSVLGTLSADNNNVYLVDDLPLSPLAQPNPNMGFPGGNPAMPTTNNPDINKVLNHSRLQAWSLATGRLKWILGDRDKGDKKPGGELNDTFFLGPPMPLAGKLYVLTEHNQELRLVCLDPDKVDGGDSEHHNLKEAIQWTQTLATTRDKLLQDVVRRTQAVHLAYGDGILVCPTNAGAVLAVDLFTHSMIWAHLYRDKKTDEQINTGNQNGGMMMPPGMPYQQPVVTSPITDWKVTAPIIQDGKVVFTAPDATRLYCLRLFDGRHLWDVPRDAKDLYLAGVYDGKVLIVGKDSIHALSLADGHSLWTLPTGTPSGEGVASDNLYYLPLRSSLTSKEPEICIIDLEKGRVFAHAKSREKVIGPDAKKDAGNDLLVPGNLVFFEGQLISQSLNEVAVFPQVTVERTRVDDLLAQNPTDPVNLSYRGELKLSQGQLLGAVTDLRAALANSPPGDLVPRTQLKLYESLTELMQNDFQSAKPYLAEYEALCQTDLEGAPLVEKRKANRLCLLAKGLEGEGDLAEAFQTYLAFSEFAGSRELVNVLDEPNVWVSPEVWAQGRIASMIGREGYTPEQRRPVEELITAKWNAVRDANDLESLRGFVNKFGSLFAVGREARLRLAERLVDESEAGSLIEAERQLQLLMDQQKDPEQAAQTAETIARLLTRKGLLADATAIYRKLARVYPQVKLGDGTSAGEKLRQLAYDKRFLPYLEAPGSAWRAGKWKVDESHGNGAVPPASYSFELNGESSPFFEKYRLSVSLNNPNQIEFRVIDRFTNEELMKENLDTPKPFHMDSWLKNQNGNPQMQMRFRGMVPPTTTPDLGAPGPLFPFQRVGHLVVLNLGTIVFGIDPINKKVLWRHELITLPKDQNNGMHLFVDWSDHTLRVPLFMGMSTPQGRAVGHVGPATASCVCLVTRDGLVALDPSTGRTLWSRSGISPNSEVFGDSQYLFVVEADSEGSLTSTTRVLRAYDGVEVKDVKPFKELFLRRVQIIGRDLLLAENDPKVGTTLHLYDLVKAADVWTKVYAPGSQVMRSEETDLAGVVEPSGKVTLIDLTTRQEIVLKDKMDPKHVEKVKEFHLLQDNDDYYILPNSTVYPEAYAAGDAKPPFQRSYGLRGVAVNGVWYAFHKDGGELHWCAPLMPPQIVLVDQFKALPVILGAGFLTTAGGAGVAGSTVMKVTSIDKRTGKLLWLSRDIDATNAMNPWNGSPVNIAAVTMDARKGTIEMLGMSFKLLHTLVDKDAAASASPGADKAGGPKGAQQQEQAVPAMPLRKVAVPIKN
jgi:outer membrane protein assembly factor BamB/tetratricopeptide (TPR) repeat protein